MTRDVHEPQAPLTCFGLFALLAIRKGPRTKRPPTATSASSAAGSITNARTDFFDVVLITARVHPGNAAREPEHHLLVGVPGSVDTHQLIHRGIGTGPARNDVSC